MGLGLLVVLYVAKVIVYRLCLSLQAGHRVGDLFVDLSDGRQLIKLLEVSVVLATLLTDCVTATLLSQLCMLNLQS